MIPLLPLLVKLPWLATAVGFVKSKSRLVIEYVLIGLLITIAGLTFTMWLAKERTETKLERAEADVAVLQSKVSEVERINNDQARTIEQLQELRVLDATTLQGLMRDHDAITKRDTSERKQVKQLEKTHEDVKSFMQQPVPPVLGCVLDGTCSGNPGSH